MTYKRIKKCRICGNNNLVEVLDLGNQALTGTFPDSPETYTPTMPLVLVKCHGDQSCCHLVQLAHTFDLTQLYGANYGYRSGLNSYITTHLKRKVEYIESTMDLIDTDLVLDIGSNDGTTLGFYSNHHIHLVGIDPTAHKFKSYYPKHVQLIPDFFSKESYAEHCGNKKAKVITCFSMFYDLPDPILFTRDIAQILDPQGIWVLEQSYMPKMLEQVSYDTVCHEHLEYYGLKQIKWIVDKAGLEIIDVDFNNINGGSFSVTVSHPEFIGVKQKQKVNDLLEWETQYESLLPFQQFATSIKQSRQRLLNQLHHLNKQGKKVVALGASTKGNVILQYCKITSSLVGVVGEVNHDKFGKFTPGTSLPIKSEDEVLKKVPDCLLILPWHLKEYFENNSKFQGYELIYPIDS